MSLVIQTKVNVLSKYINDFTGQDGVVRHYHNITTLNNGRPDVIGVSEELYAQLEEGHTYFLGGGCSSSGKTKNWWFNQLIKEDK